MRGTGVVDEGLGESNEDEAALGLSASAVRVSTTGEGWLAGLHRRGVGDSGGVDAIIALQLKREGSVSNNGRKRVARLRKKRC